jgi:hypothetical protein
MMSLWKLPSETMRATTFGPVGAPVLCIGHNGHNEITLPADAVSRVLVLRIGEALAGPETGWVVFQRAHDAVACSMELPGLMAALYSPFGAQLETARMIDMADAAAEPRVLRQARSSGVTILDLPMVATIAAASVITGRGVRIADLPTIL